MQGLKKLWDIIIEALVGVVQDDMPRKAQRGFSGGYHGGSFTQAAQDSERFIVIPLEIVLKMPTHTRMKILEMAHELEKMTVAEYPDYWFQVILRSRDDGRFRPQGGDGENQGSLLEDDA